MPEPGELYLDLDLTNVSIGYRNPGYVAEGLLPIIGARAKFGKYPIFGFERFGIPRTLRAPRTASERIDWTLTRGVFECDEHSLEMALDDQERDQQGSINAETTTVGTLTDNLLLAREKRVADLVTDDSIITQGTTLVGADQWNDVAGTSTPVENIQAAHQTILEATGLRGNTLLIPGPVFNALETHPQIRDYLSFTGTGGTDARLVTPQILAVIFRVQTVLIADTLYNAANENQAADLDPIWGDNVILAHVVAGPALEVPRLGATINWEQRGVPRTIDRYREAQIKSDVFVCAEHVDEVIMCAAAGYLIQDVLG